MENNLHLNPTTRTPPVNCPLLIQLPTGRLVRVERRQWVTSHSEPLEFYGEGIGYWGRYEWTYA
jgi:hypothetical protein